MPSLLCCGPKLAACGVVLSIWGIVMLVLLGVFFNVHSAILLEDVPYDPVDMEKDMIGPVYSAFEQVSYNCFIAAALYVVLGLWALCQARLNKRRQYLAN